MADAIAAEAPNAQETKLNGPQPEPSTPQSTEGDESKQKKMNNVLMISSRKPRGFYERAAKELFASGDDIVKVSALGDAITLAVELANTLEQKNAAKITKVETKYQLISRQYKSASTSPGIQIVLEKNPGFRCSRIIPGYVSFCEATEDDSKTPVYDEQPLDTFASLNSGDAKLGLDESGVSKAFRTTLEAAKQDVSKYAPVHEALLKRALAKPQTSEDNPSEKDRTMLVESEDVKSLNPDLKVSYCRICPEIKSDDGSTGAVFIDIFDDAKRPHHANNYAMIYVVAPKGSSYETKETFLDAVQKTAVNLMTAFCDYNGMVKRSKSASPLALKRINVIRVCLFSGGDSKHKDASKKDVADAILDGMSKGYHYGPSPRLNFAYDDNDVFRQVWIEMTGLTTEG